MDEYLMQYEKLIELAYAEHYEKMEQLKKENKQWKA